MDSDRPTGEPPSPPRTPPPWARSGTARGLTTAGIVLVAMGSFLTGLYYAMLGTAAADDALDARGITVMATPVSHRLSSTSKSGAVKRYAITFTFTDERGQILTATIESNHSSQVEAAEAKTPLEIEVDPTQPHYARWPGTRLNPMGNAGYGFTGMLAALGVVLGLAGMVRARRDRRVYRDGIAMAGRLDRVEVRIENRRQVVEVEYSYVWEGTRVQSMWTATGVEEPVAGPIWVIVDESDAFVSIPALES